MWRTAGDSACMRRGSDLKGSILKCNACCGWKPIPECKGIWQTICRRFDALMYVDACRGDVGSWVREAAIIALAQLLPLWWQHASSQKREHTGNHQGAADSVFCCMKACRKKACSYEKMVQRSFPRDAKPKSRPDAIVMTCPCVRSARAATKLKVLVQALCEPCKDMLQTLHPDPVHVCLTGGATGVAEAVVKALLRQATERLDRLRKVEVLTLYSSAQRSCKP